MLDERQPLQDHFRSLLLTVAGEAFDAAGYTLEERPHQWMGGKFRFRRQLPEGLFAFIEFQALVYADSMWSSGMPSRFRVTLIRSDRSDAQPSQHPAYISRSLSALVVEDFGVAILPDTDHWWTFKTTDQLGHALAEAGHLIIGYGLPWLSGYLQPPSSLH